MVIAASVLNFQPKQATLPVKSFLQRLLLITNANVIDIIRAYAGEEIEVVQLPQKLVEGSSLPEDLSLEQTPGIVNSSFVLRGKETKTSYLYTDSYLVPELLNVEVRDELLCADKPVRNLLLEDRIKVEREVVDCGFEPVGDLVQHFVVEPSSKLIYRTYIVLINGLKAMQIVEKFPTCHFID